MSPFIYPTDPRIIEELTGYIEDFHTTLGTSWPVPPTTEQLKELLDCSFAASLETEEGRGVTFTVSFFADRGLVFPYQLNQPLLLSPGDLIRLAVALDPSRSRICITPGDESLQIAGLVHLGEQDSFHGVRTTVRHLSVRVLGSGTLLVRYGDKLLFTYRRGRFAFHVGESTTIDEYHVQNALSFRIDRGPIEQFQEDARFKTGLVQIARTMLRQRHGGTLLIIPDGADWEAATSSKRYAPTAPVSVVKDANTRDVEHRAKRDQVFQKLVQGQPSPDVHLYWEDYLARARLTWELDWLAGLTATDGMTVIRPDFTLLAFGVFFKTQEDPRKPTSVVVIDPYDNGNHIRSQHLETIGGARHQSAVVTCRRIPGAIAIVASQDGSLSSMRLDTGHDLVVMYPHLELVLDI
jgi:hypothetical protein